MSGVTAEAVEDIRADASGRARAFDIARASWSSQGVDGFYWPVSRRLNEPVRDSLLADMVALGRDGEPESGPAWAVLVLRKYFLFEALSLFEAVAMWRRISRDGARVDIPDRFARLKALSEGRTPSPGLFASLLPGPGPERDTYPVRIAKRVAREMHWNGLPPWVPSGRRGVLVVGHNSLLIRHAREQGVRLLYGHFRDWFKPLDASILERESRPSGFDAGDWLRGVLSRAFSLGGEECPDEVVAALLGWVRRAANFVDHHMERLRASRRLPGELWCGSPASSPWAALLACAVRRAGGMVVAHDHGFGDSQHEQLGHYLTTYPYCDEFYTYNRTNVRIKKQELRRELLGTGRVPEFSCPDRRLRESSVPSGVIRRPGPLRKLMYVPTAYHGEGARARPILSDVQMLDYQARLLGLFRQAGVDVLVKPHPEGRSRAPEGFAESFGFRTCLGRFEDIQEEFDAYVIDFISSTTTHAILSDGKPVIFIDNGYPRITDEAYPLIKRRCMVVKAYEDDENRIRFDTDALARALRMEDIEFSMDFVAEYYDDLD